MKNTATASSKFAPLLDSSAAAMQEFSSQTLPAANSAAGNFSTVGNNLSAASLEIKQNPAILIRGKTPRALGPGE
jgi:phospholipid/cholesterol/gamma-HCH transport system substrate-binding protein